MSSDIAVCQVSPFGGLITGSFRSDMGSSPDNEAPAFRKMDFVMDRIVPALSLVSDEFDSGCDVSAVAVIDEDVAVSSGLKRICRAGRCGNVLSGTGGGLAKARNCMNTRPVRAMQATKRYKSTCGTSLKVSIEM